MIKQFVKSHEVLFFAVFFWVVCGLWHLMNLWFDGIYQEAFEKSYTLENPFYRHWVIIPMFAKSFRIVLIIVICIACGPFARRAVAKIFGIEYDPDAGWENF